MSECALSSAAGEKVVLIAALTLFCTSAGVQGVSVALSVQTNSAQVFVLPSKHR